jgi:F-type H+-transporting ATPase subunit b
MADMSAAVLVAQEGGGTQNFLLPNGTFFFTLLIFLIVLGVITKWVVPPINKVLREREAMVQKTAEDNRKSAELAAATEADTRRVLDAARREASATRDEARNQGRAVLEDMRSRASEEAAATLKTASEELSRQGEATRAELEASVEALSAKLAGRVLGIDVGGRTSATTGQGR